MRPDEEESRRQSEWDRKCYAAPHCECCGESVYQRETYLEIDGHVYCERCVDRFTKYTEDLEV